MMRTERKKTVRPSPIIPGEEEKCKRLRRLFLRPDAAKAWNGGGMQKEKKPELSAVRFYLIPISF